MLIASYHLSSRITPKCINHKCKKLLLIDCSEVCIATIKYKREFHFVYKGTRVDSKFCDCKTFLEIINGSNQPLRDVWKNSFIFIGKVKDVEENGDVTIYPIKFLNDKKIYEKKIKVCCISKDFINSIVKVIINENLQVDYIEKLSKEKYEYLINKSWKTYKILEIS